MISSWQRIFLYLSGTDIKTISQCPSGEITRYSFLGVFPLIAMGWAFFSSTYALSYIFPENIVPYIFGLFWGLTILNIDRAILAKNPSAKKNWGYVGGRIILSFFIGMVVAEPLCIEVFKDQIDEQYTKESKSNGDKAFQPYKQQIKEAEGKINAAYAHYNHMLTIANDEQDGRGKGSGKRGQGNIYESKRIEADSAQERYLKIQREELKVCDSLRNEGDKARIEAVKKTANGLLGRIEMLSNAAPLWSHLFWAVWFIRCLFICVELLPLILKGSLKRSTDAYVAISNAESLDASTFYGGREDKPLNKRLEANLLRENKILERILRRKDMEDAVKDYNFFFNMYNWSAKKYSRTKGKLEKAVTHEMLRTILIGDLLEAYTSFSEKIKGLFVNSNKNVNDDDN